VVAVVDRTEQRLEVGLRPGFSRGRDEHEWQTRPLETNLECAGDIPTSDLDDAFFNQPSRLAKLRGNRPDDGCRLVRRPIGEQDD
jgi:hypothetical protein